MLYFVMALNMLLLSGLVIAIFGIARVRDDIYELSGKLDQLTTLSLNPRTRIGQATMQSGPVTEEQQLERLSRASVARRVVVGGDDDSVQKQNLMRGISTPPEVDHG